MIDWTKPLRTRDGRKARLLGEIEGAGSVVMVVAVQSSSCENPQEYYYNGQFRYKAFYSDHALDLENVPEKKERWISIWKTANDVLFSSALHVSPEMAAAIRDTAPLANLKMTFEENTLVNVEIVHEL